MDVKEITLLIDPVSKAEIKNFHLQKGDFCLAMDKLEQHDNQESGAKTAAMVLEQPGMPELITEENTESKKEEKIESENFSDCIEIKSPIVGTFYSAAGPNEESFVKVGDHVTKGQILCIIEAMKLMNEIESETEGEIVEVLVRNEDMVDYNQPLYRIRSN